MAVDDILIHDLYACYYSTRSFVFRVLKLIVVIQNSPLHKLCFAFAFLF